MLARMWKYVRSNRKAIILTFEIFWIFIFLLERVSSANSVGIPQFIYVNF